MHEVGLCEGIVSAVVERAGERQVTRVRIRAGVQQRVVHESLEHAFREVADGTVAEDAEVELEVVPVTLTCAACGSVQESDDAYAACPACGSVDVETAGGDELTLVSISLRSPEEPVPAG